jgi:hypothetical protein
MVRTGLVSVTFRKFGAEAVVELARRAGLELIEWGGDVHVPVGDRANAERVRAMTLSAGLAVAAYGSYFRLGLGQDFKAILETGLWLGAPTIRIWAGNRGSRDTGRDDFIAIARELGEVARQADAAGITVSVEFHPSTLTDSTDSAVALIAAADHPAVRSYWQVPPGWGDAEQQASLQALRPWLSNLHVFHWTGPGTERRPLAEAQAQWRRLLDQAGADGGEHGALLEFVRDDSPQAFAEDAACLKTLLQPPSAPFILG